MLIQLGRLIINPEHIDYIEELKSKSSYLIVFSSGDSVGLSKKEYTEFLSVWNPEKHVIGVKE